MAKANEPSEPRVKQEDKLSSFTCAGAEGSIKWNQQEFEIFIVL